MDYVTWCHRILAILNDERHNPKLTPLDVRKKLSSENQNQLLGDSWSSVQGQALLHALNELKHLKFISERHSFLDITIKGEKLITDPYSHWEEICLISLDEKAQQMLRFINQNSQILHNDSSCVSITIIKRNDILAYYGLPLPEIWSELDENYEQILIHTPYVLYKSGLARIHGGLHDYTSRGLSATYWGIVWQTKRGETLETKFIDEKVKEWETTNIEFKRELFLNTNKQKAEFAKDVLGLANTKSSGRRYLIIGFDDKTRNYYAPPDENTNQEKIERILSDLTNPVVQVRYEVVDYRLGKVGKLEVIRKPENLPYKAAKNLFIDEKRTKGLEKDKIYVRHGSQTEVPTDIELKALINEGEKARNNSLG